MAVLTSLGVKFYVGERTSTTTTDPAQELKGVIEVSEFDLDPDTIDTTSFDDIRYKSSVAGLIDTSGIQSLTVNVTDEVTSAEDTWNALAGKDAWLKVTIPNKKDRNTYIPILPIKTGAYNLAVNDRITVRLRFTIAGDMKFGSTLADAT
jgi:hypothetical protein